MNTIWCVGRNYADHAKELGNEVPKRPLIFTKAFASIQQGSTLTLWPKVQEMHYEFEIVLKLGKDLKVSQIAGGIDLTDRTAQAEAKASGLPWARAKSFPGSTVIGKWVDVSPSVLDQELQLVFKKNGVIVQQASTLQMLFSFNELLQELKENFPLTDGDLIFTGTPSGVGPLQPGDQLEGEIKGLTHDSWTVF